jgi:DNA-binding NarL/FixJ family response regulator
MPYSVDSPARLLIVDDHPIVRLGVRQMIRTDPTLSVSAEADSAETALQVVRGSPIDLVIVDLSLGETTGLDLIRALRETAPDLPVLVLSVHDELLFAERALSAGARGYITKRAAIGGLVRAIRQVLAGSLFVSEDMAPHLTEHTDPAAAASSRIGKLTAREFEVFDLIGRGLSTAAIAERLALSVKTIETYRSNIKAKLDLKHATDLVRYAALWTGRV